jgi:DNA processing protein
MPLVLFARGEWLDVDWPAIGIVGTRRPSAYGVRQAQRFASCAAARRVTVISGLARGVDAAAQTAALDSGGRTIAVLGSGLGRVYPPENRRLAETIAGAGNGAVVSEFPFLAPPRSFHFPQRNRLISGLSHLLLVIEAGARSGSLSTVEWALRQGRQVAALPGRVDQPQAIGALQLLRDGATPALEPDEILEMVQPGGADRLRKTCGDVPTAAIDGPLARPLADLFAEEDSWHADQVAARLGIDPSSILAELTRLEIAGVLRQEPGGGYCLRR